LLVALKQVVVEEQEEQLEVMQVEVEEEELQVTRALIQQGVAGEVQEELMARVSCQRHF
jgi:hypothetical protein